MAKNLLVIGAGQMGQGIAQVFATSGFQVVVHDVARDQLDRAKDAIGKSAAKLAKKGKLTDDQAALANTIEYADQLNAVRPELVIEAVNEDEDLKRRVLQAISKQVSPECILATNTSSIPITRLAASVPNPERFIGLHFMNPVPIMPLVEVINGLVTSSETAAQCRDVLEGIGKTVVVSKDFPGFIVNRILMPMINEAFMALMESVGTAKDIDQGMKLGTNQPMGPLELADFIGLDTCRAILIVMFEGTGNPKYSPSPLLTQFVEAGRLGRKTGRGVFEYF